MGRPGQLGQGCRSPVAIAHSRVAGANASVESEQRNKERSSVLRFFVVAYLLLILCLAFFWLLQICCMEGCQSPQTAHARDAGSDRSGKQGTPC